jgi:hypothetical protein
VEKNHQRLDATGKSRCVDSVQRMAKTEAAAEAVIWRSRLRWLNGVLDGEQQAQNERHPARNPSKLYCW